MKFHLIGISLIIIFSLFLGGHRVWAQQLPASYGAMSNVNIRCKSSTNSQKVALVSRGHSVTIDKIITDPDGRQWGHCTDVNGNKGWVCMDYMQYREPVQKNNINFFRNLFSFELWTYLKWILYTIGAIFLLGLFAKLLELLSGILLFFMRIPIFFVRLISLPFFIMNTFQRYLAKPWIIFFHNIHFSDNANERLRTFFEWMKVPLYLQLTPLRLVNAIYFNLIIHCSFEFFNYVIEIILPSNDNDGGDGYLSWIIHLPKRIIRYGIWHPLLTFIESIIWTAVDTILPALTLFHGTTNAAAEEIVSCPNRTESGCRTTGVWNVGGGNFAGNGIYFAPARSTSVHYAHDHSLIVCRVTLGKTLDLGLAPYNVFCACGHPNALSATQWGLKHGYVTGEWWRADSSWWEYCMYDWKNRYNYSWRIRPLYVINLEGNYPQRIPCGMAHWLFRSMVIKDIGTSIEKHLK